MQTFTLLAIYSLFSPLSPQEGNFYESHLRKDLKALSSDDMLGRGVASPGEERATSYIRRAFQAAGLEPGNPDGTYFQKFPLVGIAADPAMTLTIQGAEKTRTLSYSDEFMAWTKREAESVEASGELLFVGYGTVAPEYNWDDYKDVDCQGKILVMLVNDPPLEDSSKFGGHAMTYYGRWSYKYEIAAAKGAAGAILIHQDERAGYPWQVVSGSWSGMQFSVIRADRGMNSAVAFESWVTYPIAQELFSMAGLDLAAMEQSATSADFTPVPMNLTGSINIKNTIKHIETKNVIGILPGSDSEKRYEYIIYTAHWDHLGVGEPVNDDKIYNGAIDNASGVTALIGLAEAFAQQDINPDRSIIFLAVSAEEDGLLGSKYYAEHPLYPLEKTLAIINMDGMNMFGPTRDIEIIGYGKSSLDQLLESFAAKQNRIVIPDQNAEKGYFYRSDHFSFAKKGVPALYIKGGTQYIGKEPDWGKQQKADYIQNRYHKPQDEYNQNWSYQGMIQDLHLLFQVGLAVAQQSSMPTWNEGSEFKAIREESLQIQ